MCWLPARLYICADTWITFPPIDLLILNGQDLNQHSLSDPRINSSGVLSKENVPTFGGLQPPCRVIMFGFFVMVSQVC